MWLAQMSDGRIAEGEVREEVGVTYEGPWRSSGGPQLLL